MRVNGTGSFQAFVDVFTQDAPDFHSVRFRNELGAQVGRAHFVGLFKHRDLARVKAVLDDAEGDASKKASRPSVAPTIAPTGASFS